MQRICNKYANICIEYAQNMQKIYAQICKYMQFICKNMQIYAAQFVPQKYAKICKNMQSICMLYAKTCKICNHVFYMQNMQKYALPTLLMELGCSMIHGAPCWQLQLLECAKKHKLHLKVVRAYGVVALTGRSAGYRAKPAREEELRPGIPRVLQGDVRRVLQG